VIAEGHESIVTQIYDNESDYLDNDTVFAVKDGLRVKFEPLDGDAQAKWELKYDLCLAPSSSS
jgi:catechol 1,2-dioxygenase